MCKQILQSNKNSSICTQLNNFKASKWLNGSIWPIDETPTSTTTPVQSGLGSNGIPKASGLAHCQQMCHKSFKREYYPSADVQSALSTDPAERKKERSRIWTKEGKKEKRRKEEKKERKKERDGEREVECVRKKAEKEDDKGLKKQTKN